MSSQRPDLIIARHARPEVQPDDPASSWSLSPEGIAAATSLGERLRAFDTLRITTSAELKAIQTGEAIEPRSPVVTDHHFSEQGLGGVAFLPGDAFREQVITHFRQPGARLLGDESSREAAFRFDAGIHDATDAFTKRVIPVIVSHGRIISAWLTAFAHPATRTTISADILWESLRMPDAFLLQHDSGQVGQWIWTRLDNEGAT